MCQLIIKVKELAGRCIIYQVVRDSFIPRKRGNEGFLFHFENESLKQTLKNSRRKIQSLFAKYNFQRK